VSMKILVVEDDAVSQMILQRSLEQMGHEVVVARDGDEALRVFQDEGTIHLVISDLHMPGMDGIELCKTIRSIKRANYIYFILVSATKLPPERYSQAVELGVDDFLIKPLDRGEITLRLLVADRIFQFTSEIRRLKMLLPICMYCKKIRDDGNYWQQIETYIRETTGSSFSHGICPDCYESVVRPELDKLDVEQNPAPLPPL
jgi:sigma-B regulation protein RsbU (phosphoserine phosphatase)